MPPMAIVASSFLGWQTVALHFDEVSGVVIINIIAPTVIWNLAVKMYDWFGRCGCCRGSCCSLFEVCWNFWHPVVGISINAFSSWRIDLRMVQTVVWHLKDHFHIIRRTAPADSSVQIFRRRCGDEIVILSGMKLQTSGSGRKWSKCDGEIQQLVRFAANGYNFGPRISNATRFIFFTADTVNDMPFGHLDIGFGNWANDIDLIIFPRQVARVDIHNVIGVVQSEHGVGSVPVDVMNFSGLNLVHEKHQQKGGKNTC